MNSEKSISAVINIALALTVALFLLFCAPWSAAVPLRPFYYALAALLWLLIFLSAVAGQVHKNRGMAYASYIDQQNRLRKKPVSPARTVLKAAASCFRQPRYIVGALALVLLFALNHLLLFFPGSARGFVSGLFGSDGAGSISRDNVWLCAVIGSVLVLAITVAVQTFHIKENNRLYNIQNLLINAHSHVAVDKLQISFPDSERMFLAANKMEYILQAKPMPSIRLEQGLAMLRLTVALKLANDFPVTEFYVKQLSLFVDDLVIECKNYREKFYPLFNVNGSFFDLNFYIHFKDVSALKLAEKIAGAGEVRLYYSFVVNNSFGVITELYGTALFEKKGPLNAQGLFYLVREAKDNQYYYI